MLIIVVSATQGMADPEEDNDRASHLTDSSTERTPAITTFPIYPLIARRDRIEGEATVCFKIDPSGRILEPSIESSTHKIFEKPALRAIEKSSFEPLASDEELSAGKTCRTYRFRLDPIAAKNEPRLFIDPSIRSSFPA